MAEREDGIPMEGREPMEDRDPMEDRVAPEGYDGRFGDRFDDEISVPAIRHILVGVVVTCVLAGIITWFMLQYYEDKFEEAHEPISPAAVSVEEERLPPGPLLQADPEGELLEMRREMSERVNTYGWVDEAGGRVRVPIDRGIDLLLERGTVASPTAGAAATSEPAADSPTPEITTATEAAAQ